MKKFSLAAAGAALALTITSCTNASEQPAASDETGYEYGADQEEIDAALADLEPVTLTYQGAASSPDSVQARDKIWAEALEERSGGKLTMDIVYGQAIAGFDEVDAALADGRVDLAYTLPGYDPSTYPNFDDLSYSLSLLPSSPFVGELVANAVGLELSWESEEVLEEFESQGLVPLFPVVASGSFYPLCTEEGTSEEDWNGRQIRAGTRAHEPMAQSIGATPVSLEYVEVYEALQRGTIDCAMNTMNSAYDYGFLEVAPHISYPTVTSAPRGAGAVVGGADVANLPLAYKQVLFDSLVETFMGTAEVAVHGNYEGVAETHEVGGTIQEMDATVQESIAGANEELISEIENEGTHGTDLGERVLASGEKWTEKAEELGFVDEGEFSDFDEWFDPETDFRPFAEAVYEEILLEQRPE